MYVGFSPRRTLVITCQTAVRCVWTRLARLNVFTTAYIRFVFAFVCFFVCIFGPFLIYWSLRKPQEIGCVMISYVDPIDKDRNCSRKHWKVINHLFERGYYFISVSNSRRKFLSNGASNILIKVCIESILQFSAFSVRKAGKNSW